MVTFTTTLNNLPAAVGIVQDQNQVKKNYKHVQRRFSIEQNVESPQLQGVNTQYTIDASADGSVSDSVWLADDRIHDYPATACIEGTHNTQDVNCDGSYTYASDASTQSLPRVVSWNANERRPIDDESLSSIASSAFTAQITEEPFLIPSYSSLVYQWVQSSVVQIVSQSTKLPNLSVLTTQPQESQNDKSCVIKCPATDLVLKEIVGSGGSCDVYEVESTDGLRLSGHMGKYVWKQLAPDALNKDEPRRVASALRDIWLEALTLSALQDHPHVISLRGWSRMDMAMGRLKTTGNLDGFGLLLDRVDTTVHDQISNWRRQEWLQHQSRQQKHSFQLAFTRPELQKGPYLNWHERLEIARDLASALEYIHGKGFMHRDVKSANVGLCWNKDGRPRVQLLDFGLAVECPRHIYGDKKLAARHFQAQVGTARYMAPEISSRTAYTEKVDVYSFSILLWEMIALEQPFADIPADSIPLCVTKFNSRPKIPFFSKSWPRRLRQLLQRGWHADMSRRPSMQKIGNDLEKIIQKSKSYSSPKSKTKAFLNKMVR